MKAIPPSGADALTTKADLAALEERFGFRMAAELAELRGELRTEMARLRGDVRSDIADRRASMEEKLRGQTWRLSGLLVATVGVGITLARLA